MCFLSCNGDMLSCMCLLIVCQCPYVPYELWWCITVQCIQFWVSMQCLMMCHFPVKSCCAMCLVMSHCLVCKFMLHHVSCDAILYVYI